MLQSGYVKINPIKYLQKLNIHSCISVISLASYNTALASIIYKIYWHYYSLYSISSKKLSNNIIIATINMNRIMGTVTG